MSKKKKNRIEIFSSENDFHDDEEMATLPAHQQKLYISLDRKQRKGKGVTLVEGFIGTENDLNDLGKLLKSKCGVGGSSKDDQTLIQGDNREKIVNLLDKMGYKTIRKGG